MVWLPILGIIINDFPCLFPYSLSKEPVRVTMYRFMNFNHLFLIGYNRVKLALIAFPTLPEYRSDKKVFSFYPQEEQMYIVHVCAEASAYQFLQRDECKYYANEKWNESIICRRQLKREENLICFFLFYVSVISSSRHHLLYLPMVIANAVWARECNKIRKTVLES